MEIPTTDGRPDELPGTWVAFIRTHSVLTDRLEAELQEALSLPLTWFDVLDTLDVAGGEVRMNALADAISLSRSGLTRLVERMEQAGMVLREPCPGDRRAVNACLTEKGSEMLERAKPIHWAGIQRHFYAHLTEKEAATLLRVFNKLLRAQAARSEEQAAS